LCEFKEIWTFRQNFIDIPNAIFYRNPSSGTRADTYGQTDGKTDKHDEANSRFSPLMKTRRKMASIFFVYLKMAVLPDIFSSNIKYPDKEE
jgi:hypothetical protein